MASKVRAADDPCASPGRQAIYTANTVLYVDTSLPVPESVEVQNGRSIMLEYSLKWLEAGIHPDYSATYWMVKPLWSFSDPESEIQQCIVSLRDAEGNPDEPVATAVTGKNVFATSLMRLDLPHAFTYEINVNCQNDAGLWNDITSEPVFVDLTRPFVAQVLDLVGKPRSSALAEVPTPGSPAALGTAQPAMLTPTQLLALEVDYVYELFEVRVGFAAWDPESGVTEVMVSVGEAPGSTSVQRWTFKTLRGKRHFLVDIPPERNLEHHKRYYVNIAAVNGAGALSNWASSDGIMIDDTPAVCVQYRVRDGTHRLLDAEWQSANSTVVAQWRGALFDLESLVDHYEVRLEDADTAEVLVPDTSVGLATTYMFQDLSLAHKLQVRTVVTAVNRAGVRSECSTNGLGIDVTGPVAVPDEVNGIVWDGNTALRGYEGKDLDSTWATQSAFASWADFVDPESGVNNYYVWAETVSGAMLSELTWVHPALKEWTMPIPTMDHGDRYRVAVRAVNRANSFLDYRSDGIEIDKTPPTFTSAVEFVLEDPTMAGLKPGVIADASARLRIRVTSADPESGMLRCRYALGTYPDGSDLSGVTTVQVADVNATQRQEEVRTVGGEEVCSFDGVCSRLPVTQHTVVTSVSIDEVLNEGVSLINSLNFYAWVVCINKYVAVCVCSCVSW